MRGRGAGLVFGCIAGCLFTGAVAHAGDDATLLLLSFERCAGVEAEQVVPLLALELRTAVELVGETVPPDLSCSCDGPDGEVVVLSVAGRETRLPLGAVDAALRARVISLALADMVEQSRRGPAATVEAPPPTQVAPPAPRPPRTPSSGRQRKVLVGAQVGGRALPETRALSLTTALSLRLPLAEHAGLATELGASVGRDQVAPGTIDERSFEVALHADGVVSASPTSMLVLGVGPRVARARLAGHPDHSAELAGRTLDGWWAGPEAALTLAHRLGKSRVFMLRFHAGWRTLTMQPEVEGDRLRAWRGPWLGVAVGAGL